MIPRERLVNALRQLKFSFKRQADKVELYVQAGTGLRCSVRRRDLLDPQAVRIALHQAGMPADEIERFIANETSPT